MRTLQRFCVKCISMCLAVSGCKPFCRKINSVVSACHRNNKSAKVSDSLREELAYWRFSDSWSGCSKWRTELDKGIELYTNASGFKFCASSVRIENCATVVGDYCENDDCEPIHEKEADAVLKSLQSLGEVLGLKFCPITWQ